MLLAMDQIHDAFVFTLTYGYVLSTLIPDNHRSSQVASHTHISHIASILQVLIISLGDELEGQPQTGAESHWFAFAECWMLRKDLGTTGLMIPELDSNSYDWVNCQRLLKV